MVGLDSSSVQCFHFRMQSKPVVFYLFMTYATIEIVRYPYYMLRVYDIDFGLITWLR